MSITLVPALMAITCHEVAHGYVADRLGDKTARMLGRLTLNPIKHLDIIGTLMIYLVGIGWAKPVPVHIENLRHPKRDMMLVAAAGPGTNFSLAIISALFLRIIAGVAEGSPEGSLVGAIADPVALMFAFSVYINLQLGIFNLIPILPLDGGRVLAGVLPHRLSQLLERFEGFGFLILLALVFLTGFYWRVLYPLVKFGVDLLAGDKSHWVYSVMKILLTKSSPGWL